MKMNLEGRVTKIRLPANPSNALMPLHEAIVNSIHAIEDSKRKNGRINIRVERDEMQGVLLNAPDGKKVTAQPIQSFIIEDNGIGFTDQNYKSFDEADTLYKKSRGGQGVGRLMWLKGFSRIEIESVFEEGEERKRRRFDFTISADGVSNNVLTEANGAVVKTMVRLIGFLSPYKEACPKRTGSIASHIVEHCLEFLALTSAPTIVLDDPAGEGTINLNDWFNKEVKVATQASKFTLRGKSFNLNHFLLVRLGQEAKHQLHLCAHKQAVRAEPLEDRIPNLPPSLKDESSGRSIIYTGYLSGNLLDNIVTPERTDFHRLSSDDLPFDGGLTWNEVVDGAVKEASNYLDPYIRPVKEAKQAQIRQYVENKAYQYRPLVKHKPDLLEDIPPNLSESALDMELYRRNQVYEGELRQRQQELLEGNDPAEMEAQDYKQKFERFLEEWNDAGKSKLASYVAYRKAILSFLNDQLKRRADRKFNVEEDIHKIIFPLRTTSDDVPADQMNLWIIDERLAYHRYLASDKYLDSLEPVDVQAHRRADIVIFDHPFAFSEGGSEFGAIVIVEFKRPMRDEYTEKENPIRQVFQYVRDIKAGKVKNKDGRAIPVRENTPFYAYILCDLTEKLKSYATDASLTPTPDGSGFFGYNANYGVYVEIVSFDKVVNDAQKRNAILFEMLNLPKQLLDRSNLPQQENPDDRSMAVDEKL